MFENLTLNQLTELRTALWGHFDVAFAEYSEELQTLEAGSAEMNAAMSKWVERRDGIKEMQAAVEQEINKRTARVCPKVIRNRTKKGEN